MSCQKVSADTVIAEAFVTAQATIKNNQPIRKVPSQQSPARQEYFARSYEFPFVPAIYTVPLRIYDLLCHDPQNCIGFCSIVCCILFRAPAIAWISAAATASCISTHNSRPWRNVACGTWRGVIYGTRRWVAITTASLSCTTPL